MLIKPKQNGRYPRYDWEAGRPLGLPDAQIPEEPPLLGPFTSTKPWFSSRNTTLGTHGSLWADICVPKSLRNRRYWALLRHQTMDFVDEYYTWHTLLPTGWHLWSKLPRMTPHIHTSFIGNVDLGYTRAIRSCISMHTCSQVSLHPGFQVSIHPFH